MFETKAREYAIHLAEICDRQLYDQLIGSKILDIKFESIPNRKTMQNLLITTDTTHLRIKTKLGELGKVVNSPFLTKDETE